ncbi:MAG TPA: sensor domain-containing diguanylate cyclase [Acidimicrobiales bacterium]|nr:sensor domain-containing diguanylate cyclase [Acidimicrobiales bacterium]
MASTEPGVPGPESAPEIGGASTSSPAKSGSANSGHRFPGTFGTRVSQIWAGHQRLATAEHTSLQQRFAALQLVRVAIVALVIAAAAFAPAQLGLTVEQVLPLTLGYLAICLFGETVDRFRARRPNRSGTPLQQMLLPVDSVYLALLTVPSGGAQSDFILLFAVQLITVTLLASPRTGIRLAMWDSVLLIAISLLQLGGPIGQLLGAEKVVSPSAGVVAVRIVGLWAVAGTTAYFSALSERELRRSKAQLDALTQMASEMEQAMEASSGPEEIGAILLNSVLGPFALTRVALLWERKGRVMAARLAAGDKEVSSVRAGSLEKGALSGSVAVRALSENMPVLVRTLSQDTDPALEAILPAATNVVVIPLRAGRDHLGLLVAEAGPPVSRRLSRRSLDMLSRFAMHAALALNNADLNAEVARLAASDSLTGLANRRELSSALMREAARTARTKQPLSLAVIDIDHFKAINDTFGHLVGDEVLRVVAAAMARNVRDVDLVARYGGEEFAIVLPNCGSDGALAVVERVRAAVGSAATVTKVTVSAGIATSGGEGNDGEGLMAAADEALYASKRGGRDRVTVATVKPPAPAAGPSAIVL